MNKIRAAKAALPPPEHEDESAGEAPLSARAMRRRPGHYLDALNPEQREAAETLDGPLLVLAGAGTGKTRVLTTRIAHILSLGRARPGEILAVTFTNKAAREMKHRIGELIGGVVEGMPWLGTFHAIGVKILRRHAELVDLKPSFTVLDTDDQIRLIKQLLQAENIDEKRWPARLLAAMIDGWKNRGLTPKRVPEGESFAFANGRARDLYAAYQMRLKELNAVDFGDLLLENLRLFQEHQDVLEKYQQRFRYMLVDEYQDTNVAQYLWLRLLAQGNGNICCVGDDDQSIYGWRGAEVDNILRFETDFPGAKVVRLERNFRSTGHILGAASALIAHNKGRLGKTLRTDGASGDKVVVEGCWDDEEEARVIGEDIEQLQRQDHALSEIAILVRASFQMRAFEDRFITLGLPYRVIGGPRFYERQEIKDATAYFDVTLNAANDLKFERVVNTPRRGLGEATVKSLHQLARAKSVPLFQAARLMVETEELKARPRKALADLIAAFDRWRSLLDTMRHTELAELILDESGYTGMWQAERSPQAQSKLENLKELIRFMEEFDTLAGFLEHVALVMDAQTEEGA
ncbi:MAG: UvrD-helicase domain-containing protein, partial [Methyloceanibacter sp.]